MEKIKTGDGSYTFINPEYKEVYHSVSGAEEEAIKKYVEPTEITKLAKKGHIKILDVCFGIGYNSAAAIDAILKSNPECKIEILGLEIDNNLFDAMDELTPVFKSYKDVKKAKNGFFENNNLSIKIVFGDAKKTIKDVKEEFDVCFFDPFSPRKQPEMWEEQFIKDVGSKIKKGGVLSTYSCATHVRINLVRAGFKVKDGPSIGRRAPSTIATKDF